MYLDTIANTPHTLTIAAASGKETTMTPSDPKPRLDLTRRDAPIEMRVADIRHFTRTEIERACAAYDRMVAERPLSPPMRKGWER